MPIGDQYKCYHCGDTWVWGEDGRDEYCKRCPNPHHESNKVKGGQTNIDCVVIEDFGRCLDTAVAFEHKRAERKSARRKS